MARRPSKSSKPFYPAGPWTGRSWRPLCRPTRSGLTNAWRSYFRDGIGNVSSSHFFAERARTTFQIEPRFPLVTIAPLRRRRGHAERSTQMGGWQTDFYIGYNIPVQHVLRTDVADATRHVLSVPISTPFSEVVTDRLVVRVILPEGAANIEFRSPFPVTPSGATVFSFLDPLGRPVLVLEAARLVDWHNQPLQVRAIEGPSHERASQPCGLQVVYTFGANDILREPAMLIGGCLALLLLAMLGLRTDLSLHSKRD